jgi:L-ornithine N5-oxygenase
MAPLIEDALDAGSSSSVAYRPSATNGVAVNGSANGTNGVHGTNGVIGTNGYHANNLAAIPSASSVNGHKPKKHNEHSPYLKPTDVDDEHDIICVGFGPASLAVAAAIHDALAAGRKLRADGNPPKMLFLEKQATFAWHAGMLLQGAKMQISFVKDLATLRDPRSEFTFLNYLHRQGRLVDFTNLSTFLPARSEYEDYLRWAASFFDDVVQYNNEVVAVTPDAAVKSGSSVKSFKVQARNVQSGQTQTFRGRHVVIATGGQPSLPKSFPQKHPRVLHSSQYASALPKLLPNQSAPYRVAVLGGGQSAAEIFKNVQTLYPNSQTRLIMRQEFLRPSDDSPL